MGTGRLEAFSDGVMAIIITVMVLALPRPAGASWHALAPLWPTLACYVLSFVFVGIYWNNHHHLFALAERVDSTVLWLNLALLFTLSLLPYATDWAGATHFAPVPVCVYAAIQLTIGLAFTALTLAVRRANTHQPDLTRALGAGRKEAASLAGYTFATIAPTLGQVGADLSALILVTIAIAWMRPSRRIETTITDNHA